VVTVIIIIMIGYTVWILLVRTSS